jgi:hypothetical protein
MCTEHSLLTVATVVLDLAANMIHTTPTHRYVYIDARNANDGVDIDLRR